jgi:hypothetical protein
MKKFRIVSVFCVALAILMGGFFAQPALSQQGPPGDVNDDGNVNVNDIIYLIDYLLLNGNAPPYPIDADVDGTAGISLGDVFQLIEHLFSPPCDLMPYTGLPPSFSNIKFTFPVITSGGAEPFNVTLDLTDNPGPDLMGIVITFSYQHQPGHVGVDLESVDFTGTIIPPQWTDKLYSIDNVNKKACLWLSAGSDDPPLAAGTEGLIATLTFTRTENPAGSATFLSPTVYPPTNSPMVITTYCADDIPPAERVLIPRYVLGRNGDVNLDGRINASDVVYLINFLFLGGPPPLVW